MSRLLAPRQPSVPRLCAPVEAGGLRSRQFSPRDPGRLEQGWRCLRTGAGVEQPFDPGRRWGYMAGDTQQRRGDLRPGAPPAGLCARWLGGQARCWTAPARAAALVAALFRFTSYALGAPGRWGSRWAIPRADGHGRLASEPKCSQARRLLALLFGEALPALQANPGRAGPCGRAPCGANLTVGEPTCSATPISAFLWRGLC